MPHSCHATGCLRPVPPALFMCRMHWYRVPPALRRQIWAAYRPGQCDDRRPSISYCTVAKAAVIAVALGEGREPDVRLYDLFLARLHRGDGRPPP